MTGMVNLFVDKRQAPPLVDTSIVPEMPGILFALFDYELTKELLRIRSLFSIQKGENGNI
ncbi:hypothetical protein ACQKOF_12590 [Lysinibacillus sp. NPDC093190]|uniref:hypothetical protein n=1 Tax=Lysinibacillus sp. NPDC093190 TaxID=3390575 RepID=UPI003CFF746C